MNQIRFPRWKVAGAFVIVAGMAALLPVATLHAAGNVSPANGTDPNLRVEDEVKQKTLDALVTVTFAFRLQPERPPLVQPLASDSGGECHFQYEVAAAADARLSLQGYLVESRAVICEDLDIDPEYVSSVEVSKGDEKTPASLAKIFTGRKAVRLALDGPLEHAVPLGRIGGDRRPHWVVKSFVEPTEKEDVYGVQAKMASDGAFRFPYGEAVRAERGGEVLFDATGAFCGFRFGRQALTISPDCEKWASLTAAGLSSTVSEVLDAASRSIFPVVLRFRSPKKESELFRSSSKNRSELTEYKTAGTLVSGKRLLIDISGARSAVPRLEKISVFLPDGTVVDATFAFVHKHMQLLAADLPEPRPGNVLRPFPDDVTTCRGHLAWLVRSLATGAGRLDRRAGHFRPTYFDRMWRDRPELDLWVQWEKGDYIVMTSDGEALWKRVKVRPVVSDVGDDSESDDMRDAFLPARDFVALANPEGKDVDSIRPVRSDEDGAIGWIGLDFQPMNHALAEELGVLSETSNGSKGVIVSRVVPGSVSEQAGVRPGWILLTIQGPGMQFPLSVSLSEEDADSGDEYPWEYFDKIPVEMLERFPAPWPKVRTSITKALFEMGIGKEITATFRVNGREIVKKLVIEKGPRYFDNAPAYRWEAGGMTVCELTSEVREYLNLDSAAPGVVVSRMESSGRAAIAGIRRFEVIKKVNGASVMNISEFEKAVKGLAEAKFDVLRRAETRVVRVTALPVAVGNERP